MVRVPLSVLLVSLGSLVGRVSADDWPFDLTTLSAPDGSVTAKFVSFGATLTELWVKDKDGKKRDVVLGYDDNSQLLTDPNHPVFIIVLVYNPIVGRYANRIKNGTFSIPITKLPQPDGPNVYHIPTNDHNGEDTLHGGIYGWDRRNWTIVSKSPTSVTYKHIDDANEGFPGTVTAYATHSVSNGGILHTTVKATATQKTPIMLTQHVYWNLDAFQGKDSDTILNHRLQLGASKVIDVDGDAVPTGEFIDVTKPLEPGRFNNVAIPTNPEGVVNPFDFRADPPRKIGEFWDATVNVCGLGCQGYDSSWIYDDGAKVTLWSEGSGIQVQISSNQPAVQVYTSYWLNTPRKVVHGGPSVNYTKWSAVAIEQEGYIDAINTPEWGEDQIYGPGRDYTWDTTYHFSVKRS